MTQEEIKAKTKEIFVYLYKGHISPNFRFPLGYGADILSSFSKELINRENGSVNIGTIVDFCIYQVYVWRDVNRWKNFSINWVFGKKAIEKYYNSKRGARYYQDLWLKELNLNRDDIKIKYMETKKHPYRKFIYMPAEEQTKITLHNKIGGFYLCSQKTTLYAPQSESCQSCIFKDKCAKILKDKYPELYRLREIKL